MLKILCVVIAAYAFSPIDLIPDFIPILGLLDDLIILPLGIWIVLKWMPTELLDEMRAKAGLMAPNRSWAMAIIIVATWVALGFGIYLLLRGELNQASAGIT